MHKTTPQFWKYFAELPASVQGTATKNFEQLKLNPFHPSLHFKRIGKFWSVRVGEAYRALAIEDGQDYVWVWIGHHDAYERIIKKSF